MKNEPSFQSCFRGLVDKRLSWQTKGPRFKTHPGLLRKIYFYYKLCILLKFFQKWNFIKKCIPISEIHFGFTNLWSQVHSSWVKAVWIWKFWSWTPCTLKQSVKMSFKPLNFNFSKTIQLQGDPNQNLKCILANIGSEIHIFKVIAKRLFKFWFGSPCT